MATRCTTVEQFVATFHRFCGDDQTFFVATMTSRPIGLETAFSIQLADKQPVLRGLCVVLDAWATADNRYKRPGIRLGIKRLTADSQIVFDRLRAASRAPVALAEATPPPGPMPGPPTLRTTTTPPSLRSTAPLASLSPLAAPPAPAAASPAVASPSSVSSAAPPSSSGSPAMPAPAMPAGAPASPSTSTLPPLGAPRLGLPAIVPRLPGLGASSGPASTPSLKAPPSIPRVPSILPPRSPASEPGAPPPLSPLSLLSPARPAPAALPPPITPPPVPLVTPAAPPTPPATARAAAPPAPPVATPEAPPAAPDALLAPDSTPPPIAVTRFQVALNVDAAPPALEGVDFKPHQLLRRSRNTTRSPRITSDPLPGDLPVEPNDPALVVDRPSAAEPAPPAPAPTAVAPAPAVRAPDTATETRTPGSSLVLPANPLHNLSDESLEGFVDCTLYEETANVFHPAIDGPEWNDDLIDPPASPAATRTPPPFSVPAMPFDTPPNLTVRASGDNESLRVAPDDPAPESASPPRPATVPGPLTQTDALFAPLHDRAASAAPWLAAQGEQLPQGYAQARASEGLDSAAVSGELPTMRPSSPSLEPRPPTGTLKIDPSLYAGALQGEPGASDHAGGPDHAPATGAFAIDPASYGHDPSHAPPATGAFYNHPGEPARAAYGPAANGHLQSHAAHHPEQHPGHHPEHHPGDQAAPGGYPMSDPALYAPYPATLPIALPAPPPQRPAWQRALLIGGSVVVAIVLAFVIARRVRGPAHADPAPVAPAPSTVTPHRPPQPRSAGRIAIDGPAIAHSAVGEPRGAAAQKPDARPAAIAAAGSAADTAELSDDDGAPAVSAPVTGSGPCRFTVATTPAGSIVRLDDQPMGPSPLAVAGSCDKHKVDVSHARYQTVTRWVTLAADKPQALDINLPRPIHAVTVMSLPPGAELSIDGHRAGTTPTVVQMMGFATVRLTFTKPGFPSVTKKVYSKLAQDRVLVKLAK